MNIGKRLKAYREYHQLTQEDLATKAGVNEKYYGRIERNESCPTVDKLEKIRRIFSLSQCAALIKRDPLYGRFGSYYADHWGGTFS